jgi:YidC/Oxa1 family membrane protein insertase
MQQNNRGRFPTIFLVLYVISTFLLFQMFMKPRAAPEKTQSVLTEARKLEAEGRVTDPNVSLSARVKKLEQAAQKYEQFFQENKKSPQGMEARFREVNVYDYLANLQGQESGTHWYDQAEIRLKEMEKAFHGQQGTVQLEEKGQVRSSTGDLGQIASARLNNIRQARDLRNRNKPTYRFLDFFVGLTGRNPSFSYAFALILIVVVLKLLTFPFQKKQYRYMQDMQRIQPLVKDMQEKMKGRPPEEINRRMMQIYKENNVNIAGGCLPMLVTGFALLPIFYVVRAYEYQFTNAKFLWIGSEMARQYTWLADNLAQFDVPLFVLYNITLVASMLMQPKPADPQQAQQQKMMMIMMPAMFGVMMWMWQWSSAFMLYWLVLNLVSMYQSWLLTKHFKAENTAGAGGSGPAGTPGQPARALEPMKSAQGDRPANGRNGRGRSRQRPGHAPRGSGR